MNASPIPRLRLVRTRQAAEYLCMSEWKLRRLIQDGLLPYLHDGEGAPFLLDIRDLDESADLRAVIVADRMKSNYDLLADYGRRRHTLVISSDLDCVRAGKCTVGIASAPRVEVIVSTQQAQASDIQFSEAFRMMVTEY